MNDFGIYKYYRLGCFMVCGDLSFFKNYPHLGASLDHPTIKKGEMAVWQWAVLLIPTSYISGTNNVRTASGRQSAVPLN